MNRSFSKVERAELLAQVDERIEASQQQILETVTAVRDELREDLEQIEEAVINGFERLSQTLRIENPLTTYERDTDGSKEEELEEVMDN